VRAVTQQQQKGTKVHKSQISVSAYVELSTAVEKKLYIYKSY